MTRRSSSFHLRRGLSGFFFGLSAAPPEKKLANISLTSGNWKKKLKFFLLKINFWKNSVILYLGAKV